MLTLHLALYTFNGCCFNSSATAANFMKIGAGGRAAGMAEAFVAVADDASAIYWNPAGLAQITDKEIFFMYNSWFQGITQEYVVYAQGIKNVCSFGIGGTFVTCNDFSLTSEDVFGCYTGTMGSFSANGYAGVVSFAQKVEKINIGFNIKWVRSVVNVTSGDAIGADIGFLYKPEKLKNLSLGVNFQNLGSRIEYSSGVSKPLPVNLKAGLSYIIGTEIGPMKTAVDVNLPIYAQSSINVGLEYCIGSMTVVRIGYKTDRTLDLGGLSGWCCGLGFKWRNYFIDYAFVPYWGLGYTNRISVLAKF